MSLDATKPVDIEEVSQFPYWIREARAAINSILAGESEVTVTELAIAAGATVLTVGTELTAIAIEVLITTGVGAATIANIRGGTEGQIKIFIFQDGNVSLTDGVKSDGKLYLNHLPALSNFNAAQDDVLALVNVDGDGSSEYGYWKELFRTISVK